MTPNGLIQAILPQDRQMADPPTAAQRSPDKGRLGAAAGRTAQVLRMPPIAADARVPVYRPYLGAEVQKAARDALEAGWLGMGALTRQFEQALEAYLELDGRHV